MSHSETKKHGRAQMMIGLGREMKEENISRKKEKKRMIIDAE